MDQVDVNSVVECYAGKWTLDHLKNMLKNSGATPEQIKEAINNYMERK